MRGFSREPLLPAAGSPRRSQIAVVAVGRSERGIVDRHVTLQTTVVVAHVIATREAIGRATAARRVTPRMVRPGRRGGVAGGRHREQRRSVREAALTGQAHARVRGAVTMVAGGDDLDHVATAVHRDRSRGRMLGQGRVRVAPPDLDPVGVVVAQSHDSGRLFDASVASGRRGLDQAARFGEAGQRQQRVELLLQFGERRSIELDQFLMQGRRHLMVQGGVRAEYQGLLVLEPRGVADTVSASLEREAVAPLVAETRVDLERGRVLRDGVRFPTDRVEADHVACVLVGATQDSGLAVDLLKGDRRVGELERDRRITLALSRRVHGAGGENDAQEEYRHMVEGTVTGHNARFPTPHALA